MRINKIPGMLLKGIGRASLEKHLKKDAKKYCISTAKRMKEDRETRIKEK